MSLLSSILEKLGLGRAAAAPASKIAPPTTPRAPAPAPGATLAPSAGPAAAPPAASPPRVGLVDVMGKLEGLASANPQKLNWKTSIVDLLKLLGLDSSFAARKALATELGCPADKMGDSAQMNVWLHKTVLQKLADNGGNIPKELLD